MGNGIAHVFAQKGFQVCLIDISETSSLDKFRTDIARFIFQDTNDFSDRVSAYTATKRTIQRFCHNISEEKLEHISSNKTDELKRFIEEMRNIARGSHVSTDLSNLSIKQPPLQFPRIAL